MVAPLRGGPAVLWGGHPGPRRRGVPWAGVTSGLLCRVGSGRRVNPDGGGIPRSLKNWAIFSTELYVLPVYRLRLTDSRTSCCSEYKSTSSVCRSRCEESFSRKLGGTSFRNREGKQTSGCWPPKRRRYRAQLRYSRFSARVMPT